MTEMAGCVACACAVRTPCPAACQFTQSASLSPMLYGSKTGGGDAWACGRQEWERGGGARESRRAGVCGCACAQASFGQRTAPAQAPKLVRALGDSWMGEISTKRQKGAVVFVLGGHGYARRWRGDAQGRPAAQRRLCGVSGSGRAWEGARTSSKARVGVMCGPGGDTGTGNKHVVRVVAGVGDGGDEDGGGAGCVQEDTGGIFGHGRPADVGINGGSGLERARRSGGESENRWQ